jgi:protein-S-isoprenylcysteine O-methyltransferase Ste14
MRGLELKIPPPAVALLTALLMWLVSRATTALDFAFPARNGFAIGLAVLGVTTAISGVITFRRARTTVNPLKPESASSLVNWGVYTVTRNPMYLGLLLVLTGWAIFLSNVLGFVFVPAFALYINRFQIAPEERALTSLFGQDFAAYQSRVRRWL